MERVAAGSASQLRRGHGAQAGGGRGRAAFQVPAGLALLTGAREAAQVLLGPERRAGGGTGAAKAPACGSQPCLFSASVQWGWWGPRWSGSLIQGREDISNLPLAAGGALGTALRAGGQAEGAPGGA